MNVNGECGFFRMFVYFQNLVYRVNNGKKFHAFSCLAHLKFGGKILCLWLNADKIEK